MHILVYPTFLIGLGEYLKKKKKDMRTADQY